MAYLFISIEDMPEDSDIWVADYYRPVLKWALKNGWTKLTVIAVAIVSIGFAGYLLSQRPFAFLPNFGEPQITVNVNLPPGTSILTTDEKVRELEQWIQNNVDDETITAIQTNVGGGGANFDTLLGGGGVTENQAALTIGLNATQDELERITDEIEIESKFIFNTCPQPEGSEVPQRELMTTGNVDGARDVVCADGSPIDNNVEVAAASVADGGFGGFALVVSGPIDAEVNEDIIDAINSVEGIKLLIATMRPSFELTRLKLSRIRRS